MNRTFGTNRVQGEIVVIEGRQFAHIGNTFYTICDACDGTGYRPGYAYSDGSRCWPCGYAGIMRRFAITGTLEQATKVVAKRVKAAAARVARSMKQAQAAVDAHEAWMGQHAEHKEITNTVLRDEAAYSSLLRELAGAFWGRELSAKQLDLISTLYTTETERNTERAAVSAARAFIGAEGEKVTVTGTVTFIAFYDGEFGTSTLVRLVTEEGNSVSWYTKGVSSLEKGENITVAGKVKANTESEKYGKESRLFYVKRV